ncbi:MAG: molybdopterin cofactor-binding domain-containing protein [Bacteroidota bacterium]
MKTKTENQTVRKMDRRYFIKSSSIGMSGIVLGMHIACSSRPDEIALPPASFEPNVYLTLNEKGDVFIVAHRSEMGQGVRTSLPSIVADELGADWERVQIIQAEGNEEKYGNQNTDGSFSVRMFYMPMRKAGASARLMLEQAAANEWKVDVSECKAINHEVVHEPSGKKLSFGQLAGKASELPVPDEKDLRLKKRAEFTRIGKPTTLVDLKDIVQGKATYGLDATIPEAKVTLVKRCPVAGGKVRSFDNSKALEVPGVIKTVQLDSPGFPTQFHNPLGGIAVIAENTWAAKKGRDALEVEWDFGPNAKYNTADFANTMVKAANTNGTVRHETGDIKGALASADKVLESTYSIPHLSHTPMEPPNAVAKFENGKCEIWAPTQNPQWAIGSVAGKLGIEEKDVTINVTLLGGGFGRKSKPDFVVEAALIAQKADMPIKLIWMREDDVQHDFYASSSVQHIKAAFDEDKNVIGWNHRSVFPTISGTANPTAQEPSNGEISQGLIDVPYKIPNVCIETGKADVQTRIGWMRSVANVQHAFAIGSMLDEIAEYRGKDAVKNALEMLGKDRMLDLSGIKEIYGNYNEPLEDYPWNTGRLKSVIEEVASKSNWGKSLGAGKGQGFTAYRSFLTYVACVVEVDMSEDGKLKIPEVHFAVDCGQVVNPDTVKNQFEGGAIFALSGALKSAITFKDGQVEQSNFHNYHVARMADAPQDIYVHLMDSEEKPTGVGEPPVPPVAPALANAIYAASGKRLRDLPLKV